MMSTLLSKYKYDKLLYLIKIANIYLGNVNRIKDHSRIWRRLGFKVLEEKKLHLLFSNIDLLGITNKL